MLIEEIINFIKSNLRLEVRPGLDGHNHICLLFGEEILSQIVLNYEE